MCVAVRVSLCECRHAGVAMVKLDSGNGRGTGGFQMGTVGVQCVHGAKPLLYTRTCGCVSLCVVIELQRTFEGVLQRNSTRQNNGGDGRSGSGMRAGGKEVN